MSGHNSDSEVAFEFGIKVDPPDMLYRVVIWQPHPKDATRRIPLRKWFASKDEGQRYVDKIKEQGGGVIRIDKYIREARNDEPTEKSP